ncbi:MAG: bifunctional salicylyl-CoA 5-hydroxylase/oxidoreductase [Myxococcales bacterium]|nr:bifunctional salicylyl-CoA 5-hydroxylase/oxidoreductase [Myxococcales bacterium]
MRIEIVGGGPAGLYFGILLKLRDPTHVVRVHERNAVGETFGWGVVFSAQTLGHFDEADPVSAAEIRARFAWWDDIDIFVRNESVRSTGHGFCGLARVHLLEVLERRATQLGCVIEHGVDVDDALIDQLRANSDLVLAADGVNSRIRTRYSDTFRPTVDNRRCRFAWLGTDVRLPAFTFYFDESPHGLFQVHAYPFVPDGAEPVNGARSTFIVECHEDVWRRAGLDTATEAESLAYLQGVFAHRLGAARLLANHTVWRAFPNIRCERWAVGNVALVGDAVHTAHFSIGSGTKLAMEDVIALANALHPVPDESPGPREPDEQTAAQRVSTALASWESARRPDVERLQTSAQTSLEWFEHSARSMRHSIHRLAFGLLTRSKRITWDELEKRDPSFVEAVRAEWCRDHAVTPRNPIHTPLTLRGVTLPNRIVVSPMCQYSAVDGMPDDWHLVHLGSRVVGGAGLVIAEATAVSAGGRITPGCTGIWNDEQGRAWARIVRFVHQHGWADGEDGRTRPAIGLQIGHAGRKSSCCVPWVRGGAALTPAEGAWPVFGPMAEPYDEQSPTPLSMTPADMDAVRDDFVAATIRAREAGFDLLELHLAHGYLLSTFLSALTNRRTDTFGGSLENRLRFPLAVVRAVRAEWPTDRPLSARISATEWTPDAMTDADRTSIAQALSLAGVDLVDCSAGGVVPEGRPVYGRMFQVPFADQVRNEAGVATITVGNIQTADQANTILAAGRADLIALARGHLADPYFTLHAAGVSDFGAAWPVQYLAAAPRRRKG